MSSLRPARMSQEVHSDVLYTAQRALREVRSRGRQLVCRCLLRSVASTAETFDQATPAFGGTPSSYELGHPVPLAAGPEPEDDRVQGGALVYAGACGPPRGS